MNDNVEKYQFTTRTYSKEEVAAGLLDYKINAVISEWSNSGWEEERSPEIITNSDGAKSAIIYLTRTIIKERTR